MKRLLKRVLDCALLLLIMAAAVLISMMLSRINDDNNPFAMAVFLLAVALVARFTNGYIWGILASLIGTFCVNYIFTYPFWAFDITYPGYPLTMAVMLVVSILISALTTQIKQQEKIRLEMEREKMHANLLRAISHDIRTPLASILGASSTLQLQELPDDDRNTLLAGIQRDAQWLVRVTENLLSVTRLAGDNVVIKKEDEVLEEIIGSAILKYHSTPGTLPVEVDSPDEILVVPVDGVLIEQVHLHGSRRRISYGRGRRRRIKPIMYDNSTPKHDLHFICSRPYYFSQESLTPRLPHLCTHNKAEKGARITTL